jgi:hypothetical protein
MRFKTYLTVWLLSLPLLAAAQIEEDPYFRDFDRIFEHMRQQMRLGIDIDTSSQRSTDGPSWYQMSPDSSSYYYFRIDTSLGGGQLRSDFFQINPDHGEMYEGMGDFELLFRQMEEMHRQLGFQPWGFSVPTPAEPPQSDELPEDRIRREESEAAQRAPKSPSGAPVEKPDPKPARSRIKTSRI